MTEEPENNERERRDREIPTPPQVPEAFVGLVGGFHFGDANLSADTGVKFAELLEDEKRHFYHTASQEEWQRAFDAIGKGNEHLSILPPEAFERESLYEDHF